MDANTLSVSKFLNENAIQYKSCDLSKPFVFISYSHTFHDSIIVQNVFQMLHLLGFNLWIDVANIPFDQNSWKNAALKALYSENCKAALFFRSENSLTKAAVADEIEIITSHDFTNIVTLDIWTSPKSTAQSVYNNMQLDVANNPNDDDIKEACDACNRICSCIDVNNSAIRLAHECKNDINLLVSKVNEILLGFGLTREDRDNVEDDYVIGKSYEEKLKEYADIANEEIIRNAEEFMNNDFGVLTERLKSVSANVLEAEDIYRHLAKVKDKNKGIKRSIMMRRDVVLRIFWISFIVLAVGFVFVSTLSDYEVYYLLEEHIDSLAVITDLFYIEFDDNVQVFVNTILCAVFDAALLTVVVVFIPALIKSIIYLIGKIRIRSIRKKGEKFIKKNIEPIPNYSLNYMCSFAINFFIRCYKTRQETDLSGAINAFDEYKKSKEGQRGVADIAPWLHDMRIGLQKAGHKK